MRSDSRLCSVTWCLKLGGDCTVFCRTIGNTCHEILNDFLMFNFFFLFFSFFFFLTLQLLKEKIKCQLWACQSKSQGPTVHHVIHHIQIVHPAFYPLMYLCIYGIFFWRCFQGPSGMTFPSDRLFLPPMIFHPFLTPSSFFSFQPFSIHMCFHDHFLGRSLPLFKMFELLPIAIALIIKCFHCYCRLLQM